MVKIDIKRVAKVARLNLSEKEEEKFEKECADILETFEKLKEINTEGVEASFHPIKLKNVWREDKIEKSQSLEDAFSNTPHKENGFFKGPRVA